MPISASSLPYSLTVSSVSGTSDTDTFVNVMKRREQVLYRSSLPVRASGVSYVETETVGSDNNLSVADRSTYLTENRASRGESITEESILFFVSPSNRFLVTDVYTAVENTIEAIPLFHKHTLKNFTAGDTLLSVEVLDDSLSPIPVAEKVSDGTNGLLYNNLVSSYVSSVENSYYYLRYSLDISGEVSTFTELLDNEPTYSLATFDDLDGFGQIIVDGRKVYLVDEVPSGFQVTLPLFNKYSHKVANEARLQVLSPVSSGRGDPWFVRVTNGSFKANTTGDLSKYYLAEFLDQSFDPAYPVKSSTSEISAYFSSSLVKLDQSSLYQDDTLFLSVLVEDVDGVAVAAFSTDSSVTGNISANGKPFAFWTNGGRVGIRGVDRVTGLVDIEGLELKSDYVFTSTYYYTEENYVFTTVDFNPLNNSSILASTVVLFVDPDLPTETKDKTLFYLVVDEKGQITDSDWSAFDPTFAQIYYYRDVHTLDPGGALSFTDTQTVQGSGDFLVLAEMSVGPGADSREALLVDSRTEGGGILESKLERLREIDNSEIDWYWDVGNWDGTPYPETASYALELPVDLLIPSGSLTSQYLGVFQQKRIRDVVRKHTSFEIYPVVKGYGPEIIVEDILIDNTGLQIDWKARGFPTPNGALYFDVFISTNYDGPWTLESGNILDTGGTLSLAISDSSLIPGTAYFIAISPKIKLSDTAEYVNLNHQAIGPTAHGEATLSESEATRIKVIVPLYKQTDSLLYDFTVV